MQPCDDEIYFLMWFLICIGEGRMGDVLYVVRDGD